MHRGVPGSSPGAGEDQLNTHIAGAKGVKKHKLAPGAELTVQGANHSRALKGSTHHKLAPGAELKVQGADLSRALKGSAHHKLAPGAELTVQRTDLSRALKGLTHHRLGRVFPEYHDRARPDPAGINVATKQRCNEAMKQ